jgi:hypothetical protein
VLFVDILIQMCCCLELAMVIIDAVLLLGFLLKVIFEHNAPELHSFVHLIVVRAFFKDTLKLVILLGNCLTLSRFVIKGTQIVVELKTTCLFPRVKEVVVLVLISRQ